MINRKSNRKSDIGCLPLTILKALVIFIIVLFFFNRFDRDKPADEPVVFPAPTVTSTAEVAVAAEATPTPAAAVGAPGLDGSNAYDVIGSLKELGMDLDRQSARAGYCWNFSGVIDGAFVSFDMTANKDYEICSASFTMTNGDNGFLYFASTLPYAAADQAAVENLLQSNVEKSISLGDAIWTITPLDNGNWLHVADSAYDAWILDNL